MNKSKFGTLLVESVFVNFHYLMYKMFKRKNLSKIETRNIFYDYFITPIATFQSKGDVRAWCVEFGCTIGDYDRTLGNCHVFIIKKDA